MGEMTPQGVFSVACNAVAVVVFALIIVMESIHWMKSKKEAKNTNTSNVMCLTVYISYVIQTVFSAMTNGIPQFTFGCTYFVPVNFVLLFLVSKGIYYSIFILRLHLIFNGSALEFSVHFLLTLFVVNVVCSVISAAMFASYHVLNGYYDRESAKCIHPLPAAGIFALLYDWGMSLFFVVFVRAKVALGDGACGGTQQPQVVCSRHQSDSIDYGRNHHHSDHRFIA